MSTDVVLISIGDFDFLLFMRIMVLLLPYAG